MKDCVVCCVCSGDELYIVGNGGFHRGGTDLLCKVETEQEALDYCAAFIQLYREEARYLDRTAPWVERVGRDYIKQRIVEDAAGREALRALPSCPKLPAEGPVGRACIGRREGLPPAHPRNKTVQIGREHV